MRHNVYEPEKDCSWIRILRQLRKHLGILRFNNLDRLCPGLQINWLGQLYGMPGCSAGSCSDISPRLSHGFSRFNLIAGVPGSVGPLGWLLSLWFISGTSKTGSPNEKLIPSSSCMRGPRWASYGSEAGPSKSPDEETRRQEVFSPGTCLWGSRTTQPREMCSLSLDMQFAIIIRNLPRGRSRVQRS